MKEAPSLALLLAKPKSKSDMSKEDHAKDLGVDDDSQQEAQEDSAISDLLDACKGGDVQAFKDALKDFLEICYPQLSDAEDDQEETPSDTEEPADKGY